MKKNIRSKSVKESLLEYNNLAATLKENTQNAVRDLLDETVRKTYASLLSESDDEDEYNEEEVEDTNTDDFEDETPETEELDNSEDTEMDSDSDDFTDDDAQDNDDEVEDILDDVESDIEDAESDIENAEEDESEAWGDFDQYKIGDGQYDFSNAKDEELVKVYKLLKNDDQVMVTQKGDNQVEIKDNETGSDYIIDMGGNDDVEETTDIEISLDDEPTNDTDNFNEMKESTERLYELVLEYDSHVGYTDNYQKKDVMTTPGMEEPGKGNDWDKGIPHGKEKPWSGYPSKKKKADAPFNAGQGKKVEESLDLDNATILNDEDVVEEATNVGGFVQQNSTSKSHVPNSNGRNARSASKGGKRIKGTANPRYSNTGDIDVEVNVTSPTNEAVMKKVNAILRENKELKKALGQWKTTLQEAAVTNLNLGQIIKLISENTTSATEKKEIIARFGKEAKTVQQSKALFEAISHDLQKNRQMNPLNEEKTITANSSKAINETQIYQSNDLLESLDLMHRLCK